MKLKNNKKGFTLVELVIVIAVIAILAAVLIPTFGSVINNAQKSAVEQEGSNLYTGILVAYAEHGDFDKYCEEYVKANGEEDITTESKLVIANMNGYDENSEYATFGTYVSDDTTIEITYEEDGGKITLNNGNYSVDITKAGVGKAY